MPYRIENRSGPRVAGKSAKNYGHFQKDLKVTRHINVILRRRRRRRRRFRIDTEVRCVGANPPFWPLEPARVKPN